MFTFLSVSSLFIGGTGFFKTYIGFILLGEVPELIICFIVFLISFSVYSLDKITDIDKDVINVPQRRSFIHGRRGLILSTSLAAYGLAIILTLLTTPKAVPIVMVPIIANAFYGMKLLPGVPRLKEITMMKNVVVAGDIGCYNLGALPPFDATDTMGSMGASIGVAHGFDVANISDPFVAVIGDSTFFHAGIAPLLNIVHNGGKSTVVILDNHTTAMTGHQDHPGTAVRLGGAPATRVDIADVVQACGVHDVHRVNAFEIKAVRRALKDALAFDGPSVVLVEGPCFFVGPGPAGAYEVDPAACVACGVCFRLGCPAIVRSDEVYPANGKPQAFIDPVLCVGCDMCAQVCGPGAIHPVDEPVSGVEQ
jgi:Pyruvate/2-oxoacid:ferredoxin oxidoreductase delta subunit